MSNTEFINFIGAYAAEVAPKKQSLRFCNGRSSSLRKWFRWQQAIIFTQTIIYLVLKEATKAKRSLCIHRNTVTKVVGFIFHKL